MSAPIAALRESYYAPHRQPGLGYREVKLNGESRGWIPPDWKMPDHRCVMLRGSGELERTFAEYDDEWAIYCRPWTEQDDADFRDHRALESAR